MKLTKEKLKQIIREEFEKTLKEKDESPALRALRNWSREQREEYIEKLTARKETGEVLPPGGEEMLARAKELNRPGYDLTNLGAEELNK